MNKSIWQSLFDISVDDEFDIKDILTMNNIKNAHSDVIFGYGEIPASGRAGKDDGGFSIAIYPDGKAIYKKYVFDQI